MQATQGSADTRRAVSEPQQFPALELVRLIGDVKDLAHLRHTLARWRPHTVFHAAAYKHVPLVEHNPAAGIKNNVLGTLRTAQAAAENGVTDFVLISTDKAVRPTNVMGASKRLAEMVLQAMAASQAGAPSGTKFSMVRFGNVLGSSGSVVPLFREQIKAGGPVTLTHAEVTRYFMTIPEAAQLVIQAGAMAKGGEVFVLDMGEPVRIVDLARRMVELSGMRVRDEAHPDGDIAISITGLRPGEKLYEELLIGDNPTTTSHRVALPMLHHHPQRHRRKRLDACPGVL